MSQIFRSFEANSGDYLTKMIGKSDQKGFSAVGSLFSDRLLGRVRRRLSELLEQGALTARERAEASDVLGELGDARFDADLYYLPCRYRGEPEPLLGFVKIPPGPFVMGEDDEKQDLYIDYPYWIARYPVTVVQFSAFMDAGGYGRKLGGRGLAGNGARDNGTVRSRMTFGGIG